MALSVPVVAEQKLATWEQAGAGLHTPLPGLLFAPLVHKGVLGLKPLLQVKIQSPSMSVAGQPL